MIHLFDTECKRADGGFRSDWVGDCDCLDCLGEVEERALLDVESARGRLDKRQSNLDFVRDRIMAVVDER